MLPSTTHLVAGFPASIVKDSISKSTTTKGSAKSVTSISSLIFGSTLWSNALFMSGIRVSRVPRGGVRARHRPYCLAASGPRPAAAAGSPRRSLGYSWRP